MTKVAWFSNSPWAGTGYGQQTAMMLPRLAAHYGAANVACLSNYGLSGGPLKLNGVQHYPTGTGYSDDVAPAHAAHFFGDEPGILVTLFDVWPLTNPAFAETPVVASWVPIDHAPVPPLVLDYFRRTGAVPIAMSKFGLGWLRRCGLDPLYAPHAVETAVMRPTPQINGTPSRSAFGIPEDRYVVGMVSANKGVLPNRKSYPEAFRAFATFLDTCDGAERRPLLYVHAEQTPSHGGIDLRLVAKACGLKIGEDVMFTDPYAMRVPLQASGMAALFSSFDVLLMPSMGEGFGIPALEAQACGVPVIGTDFSAQPELIEAGWVVEGEPFLDLAQQAWLVTPNVAGIVKALDECMKRTPDQVAHDAAVAVAHAATYDADVVWAECWLPILAELEQRLPSFAPIVTPPAVAA